MWLESRSRKYLGECGFHCRTEKACEIAHGNDNGGIANCSDNLGNTFACALKEDIRPLPRLR